VTETLGNYEISAEATPNVRILYFGAIRAAAGTSGEEVKIVVNTALYQLLRELAVIHGDSFFDEIFEEGGASLREDLTVTVNDVVVNHASVAETGLAPGDKIALYPIFPGGG